MYFIESEAALAASGKKYIEFAENGRFRGFLVPYVRVDFDSIRFVEIRPGLVPLAALAPDVIGPTNILLWRQEATGPRTI